jgi:hypothetical protein
VQGHLDEEFAAAYCPPETVLTCAGDATVLANICTDQSAILGLVRHLHNLGCTILALESSDPPLETRRQTHRFRAAIF